MFAIQSDNLTKHYGNHVALEKLTMHIPKGAICGFLGKNGAGKTTTIKMIVGLSKPTSGSISLMGEPHKYGSYNNSLLSYLPDVPNFYGYMNAREYLEFCGKLHGMESTKRKERINELLKEVGLDHIKHQIAGFSRGMKQRLGIAQALINNPEIILMDEPISALDPIGRNEVLDLIRSLKGKTTVFFSTHVLADVETTCDYVVILDKGKLIVADSIENVKQQHAKNICALRFFTASDCEIFVREAKVYTNIIIDVCNSIEVTIQGDNMKELGRKVSQILAESGISMESYHSYVPSLEDIFMKVTSNE